MAGKRVYNYCQAEHDINKRLFFSNYSNYSFFEWPMQHALQRNIAIEAQPSSVELFSIRPHSATGQVPDERSHYKT